MDTGRFQRVNEIFSRACAAPAAQRDELIAELAGDDADVAAEVRALIEIDKSIPGYLKEAQIALNAAARVVDVIERGTGGAPEHPEKIGRYEILDVLGEGGMGIVYRARQDEPMRREVALKLIRPGMDSKQVVARFKAERQALAMLDHPGVAHVYDGGMTGPEQGSRPYFVMELVRGTPITRYCDQKRLSMPDRLRLFEQVCDAVQHAHQRGIIHRDLKPSNVLIVENESGETQAKVIDFGVAKAISEDLGSQTMISLAGQLVGTPEYMSPEQAALDGGDVDTRSDIYSLGVMLYELMTGHLPFDASRLREGGLSGVQRMIREDIPSTPSTRLRRGESQDSERSSSIDEIADLRKKSPAGLIHELRGDLDWIVMKCLEKERDRRYDSPSALADDLRRHLRHEPVEAGPPSATYRARKFVRRNRTVVLAATLLLITLLGGVVGTSWGLVAALDAGAQTKAARDDLQVRADELQVVTEFQQAMLEDADVDRIGREIVGELMAELEDGLAELDEVERERQRGVLKDLISGVNHADLARRVLDTSILSRAADSIGERFADRPGIAASLHFSIGRAYMGLAIPDGAELNLVKSLEIAREHLGEDDIRTILPMSYLGYFYNDYGRTDEAGTMTQKALETAQRVLGPDHIETLRAMQHRASWEGGNAEPEVAESRHLDAIDAMERVLGVEHELTIATKNQLGTFLSGLGRHEEAAQLHRELLEVNERLYGEDSVQTLASLNNLAISLMNLGRNEEAAPFAERMLGGYRRVMGGDHWMTINALNTYGYLLLRTDRAEEAEPLFRTAMQSGREALGADHGLIQVFRANLGEALLRSGRAEEGEVEIRGAWEAERLSKGPSSLTALWRQNLLADALRGLGRGEEAMELHNSAIAIADEHFAPAAIQRVRYRIRRAVALRAMGRYGQADEQLIVCRDLAREHQPPDHVIHREVLQAMIELQEAWHEAEPSTGHDARAQDLRGELEALGV